MTAPMDEGQPGTPDPPGPTPEGAPQSPAPGPDQPASGPESGPPPQGAPPAYGQQPLYPPAPYGYPPQPVAYALPNAPGAVPALVLGIIGIVLCQVCGPFAWWQGKQAEDAIAAAPGSYGGKGLATAGKILGIVGTVLLGFWILFAIGYVLIIILVGVSSS